MCGWTSGHLSGAPIFVGGNEFLLLGQIWRAPGLFPTCQVRVVRFYVSLFSFSFSSASSTAFSSVTLSCRDSVSSVWHAGAQLRSCEFGVACWTPTAILVSAVLRAGPQLWSREFSAVCRTSTAIPRGQCGMPDLNCDYASSVWRAGPHLWWKGLVVVAERVCQRSSCKMSQDKSGRMSGDMFARRSERMCQREWSKICQECQKILLCLKEVQRECLGKVVRNMFKNMSARMSARSGGNLK